MLLGERQLLRVEEVHDGDREHAPVRPHLVAQPAVEAARGRRQERHPDPRCLSHDPIVDPTDGLDRIASEALGLEPRQDGSDQVRIGVGDGGIDAGTMTQGEDGVPEAGRPQRADRHRVISTRTGDGEPADVARRCGGQPLQHEREQARMEGIELGHEPAILTVPAKIVAVTN